MIAIPIPNLFYLLPIGPYLTYSSLLVIILIPTLVDICWDYYSLGFHLKNQKEMFYIIADFFYMTKDNLKTNKKFNNVLLFHEHFFITRLYAPYQCYLVFGILSVPYLL